jgi:ribulose-phosphate 3-epimerase
MSFWQPFPTDRVLAELSLWSADAAHFADAIARTAPHADLYHIDASDGHFAPLLLFFPDLVAQLRPLTHVPFHVHLMATNDILFDQIDHFVAAGADLITIHIENGDAVPAALARIRHAGRATGLALGLDVSPEATVPYLDQVDLVTLMGTRIGVKGQDLDAAACARIQAMRQFIHTRKGQHIVKVAADGGIRRQTVPLLRAAGADTVVMGTLAFGSPDLAGTMTWLHQLPLLTSR